MARSSFARLVQCGLLAVALAPFATVGAQAAWPDDRPIEIVVGYQAGSGPDILARRLAPPMVRHLSSKANFVITNRPGASGEIALAAATRAEANGYTIASLVTPSFIMAEFVKKPQFDPTEIVLLARIVDDPTVIIASATSPIKDLRDLVDRLKAKPGSLSIGHNGLGTNGHLATLAIEKEAGAKLIDVPFKGSSESRTALLGGHVDLAVQSASEFVMDRESAGHLRAIATFGSTRTTILPDLATAHDLGFDIEIASERGFAVRRGVPQDIITRLEEAIAAAVKDPEFVRGTSTEEMSVSYLPGSEWAKSMAERRARYVALWNSALK